MDDLKAIAALSAIAQPTRLRCVRHLIAHGESSAGELASVLNVPQNTMSAHLAILTRAGLLTSRKAGRQIIYNCLSSAVADLGVLLKKVAESP